MNDFLHSAEEQLKFNKDKTFVMTELSDHIETKKEFFKSIGYDQKTGAEKANEAMGNGEIVGQRLNMIHNGNTKLNKFIIVAIFIVNLTLICSKKSLNDTPFLLPFLWTLLVFAGDFLFTAYAIRIKNACMSYALMAFSLSPTMIENFILAYPICNLIVQNIDNAYEIANRLNFEITFLIYLIFIIPNVVNLYHCKRIKQLKNTKKQNTISRFMRNACIIMAIGSIVLSVPYNMMNDHICEERLPIRDELIAFTLDTTSKFGYDEWEELVEYLENCKYEFEYTANDFQSEPDSETYIKEFYRYNSSSWRVTFYRDSRYTGYEVSLSPNEFNNPSLKYLYATDEKIEKLIKTIGDPKAGSGNAIGYTTQDIEKSFVGFNLYEIEIFKRDSKIIYDFWWRQVKNHRSGYSFDFNEDNICYHYELF